MLHKRWGLWTGLALVVLAAIGWVAYDRLLRTVIPVYASDEEHFKYGSIGNDRATGIPYGIWLVLPKVFADFLPGPDGYASLGFRWEPGHAPSEAPIGLSRARVGVERMSINCAVCHVTTFRPGPDAPLEFALGGVSNTLDVLGYQRFLIKCARDPRFSPAVLIPAIAQNMPLSWLDRLLYRFVFIPFTRKALLQQGVEFAWTEHNPDWGPGRIDPFNPVKFGMLGLADDGTIGNSNMQPVWGLDARMAIRAGAPWHRDGLNTSLPEVVLSSALGDGMDAKGYDAGTRASLERIARFLGRTQPPPSPYRPGVGAVARGRAIYVQTCGACHEPAGPRVLTVIPVGEVGTDRHRLDMWTVAARNAYNAYRKGYDWAFANFQKTDGYVSEPLTGLWLRAPYLHNGSVPTLADLLTAPGDRPRAFVRGIERLDPDRGGFMAPSCVAGKPAAGPFCYDTSLAGNSNEGHAYGTQLPDGQKADLLAYLLTL